MSGSGLTALGQARSRFLEGLSGRTEELRAELSAFVASPTDPGFQEALRRGVHRLYASAQVVSENDLADQAREVLQCLDEAEAEGTPLSEDAFGLIQGLLERLAQLAQPPSEVSRSDPPARLLVAARLSRPPGPAETPVEVMQTSSGVLAAPAAAAVLVIDDLEVIDAVRAALPRDRVEVAGTPDPDAAVRLMRATAPDVVLVDAALAADPGQDLIRRLRTDPVVDVRRVMLLSADGCGPDEAAEAGADGVLRKPVDAEQLRRDVQAWTARPEAGQSVLQGLTGGTVADIAERVAEEVRRGITDSVQVGQQERIALPETTELMAAAWSAVGRVRAQLQASSDGRVRFHDALQGGGPAALALTGDARDAGAEAQGTPLAGRRILVADDDPSVVWFFAGLLREAGASVLEARNGHQALELARLRRPDVVVSDILMPGIDGFALCRELKRDLLLSEVPVVLLSWKEDFLQRMRELQSGASGYLRKEAGSRQILTAVVDVLRPRTRLEGQLRAGGELGGRVDEIGVLNLLEAIARHRPNAHLSVRDAFNVFELDVRDGTQLSVSRTAADGSFGRGSDALSQLMGVSAGRFVVTDADAPLRGAFEQPMEEVLDEGARRLGGLLDAVSDAQLLRVASVEFDEAVLPTLFSATPTHLIGVVEHLRSLGTDGSLVMRSGMSPHELERDLRELSRRGAIRAVYDPEGEDLARVAMEQRLQRPGTLFHSSIPPAPAGGRSGAAAPPTPEVPPDDTRDSDAERPSAHAAPPGLPMVAAGQRDDPDEEEHETGADAGEQQDEPSPARGSEQGHGRAAGRRLRAQGRARRLSGILAKVVLLGVMGGLSLTALYRAGLSGGEAGTAGVPVSARAASSDENAARVVPPTVAAAAPAPKPMEIGAVTGRDAAVGSPEVGFGRVLPFIDRSRGVSVGEGEGLLVIEPEARPATHPYQVRVGDRELGAAPVEIALLSGRYELVFTRDGVSSFRYLLIREGETRIVGPPSPPPEPR